MFMADIAFKWNSTIVVLYLAQKSKKPKSKELKSLIFYKIETDLWNWVSVWSVFLWFKFLDEWCFNSMKVRCFILLIDFSQLLLEMTWSFVVSEKKRKKRIIKLEDI